MCAISVRAGTGEVTKAFAATSGASRGFDDRGKLNNGILKPEKKFHLLIIYQNVSI